jgi:hypothetical protein
MLNANDSQDGSEIRKSKVEVSPRRSYSSHPANRVFISSCKIPTFMSRTLINVFYLIIILPQPTQAARIHIYSSNPSMASTTSSGVWTCHPANVFFAGGPTVVEKMLEGMTWRWTSGSSPASSGSMAEVMATGGRRMTGASAVGPPGGKTVRSERNISSSV